MSFLAGIVRHLSVKARTRGADRSKTSAGGSSDDREVFDYAKW